MWADAKFRVKLSSLRLNLQKIGGNPQWEGEAWDATLNQTQNRTPRGRQRRREPQESEFKIQIVPRQRNRGRLQSVPHPERVPDISFNILDKLGDQKESRGPSFLPACVQVVFHEVLGTSVSDSQP